MQVNWKDHKAPPVADPPRLDSTCLGSPADQLETTIPKISPRCQSKIYLIQSNMGLRPDVLPQSDEY